MAKCYVEIGFAETVEKMTDDEHPIGTGVYEEIITPRNYYADLTKNFRNTTSDNKVNSDILLNNTFSIIADPYASENYFAMRYIKFRGCKWKVSGIDAQYPRLIINVGGIYNGYEDGSA